VTGEGPWAFSGNVLTFWDSIHHSADTLTLHFAAGATTLQLQPSHHDLKVV
jgi:hypothetical protein